MKVRNIFNTVSNSTTICIHIAATKQDAINEVERMHYYYAQCEKNACMYKDCAVVYIYPRGKDMLDVWILA